MLGNILDKLEIFFGEFEARFDTDGMFWLKSLMINIKGDMTEPFRTLVNFSKFFAKGYIKKAHNHRWRLSLKSDNWSLIITQIYNLTYY